jgi:hypothetical protein
VVVTGRVVDVAGVSQVIRYLRGHGFAHAERRQLARGREVGGIDGVVGVEWGIKPGGAGAGGRQVAMWLAAVDAHRVRVGAELGVLVLADAEAEPGDWPAVLVAGATQCARLPLSQAVELLVGMGYGGDPGEAA